MLATARRHQTPAGLPARQIFARRRELQLTAATAGDPSDAYDVDEPQTDFITASGLPDYYCVLGVDDDAAPEVIKVAYRALAKACHPDFLGAKGHNISILLNEAYSVLSDTDSRNQYNLALEQALADEDDSFSGQPLSKWLVGTKMSRAEDPHESRGVFVDENTCIGCTMCASLAPATFRMESEHGRSRVFAQWANNDDDIADAVSSCPVDCIHWVQKDELAALEWVMQVHLQTRTDVGMMLSGQGGGGGVDVFQATDIYMKKRQSKMEQRERDQKVSKAQAAARRRAASELQHEKDFGRKASWWSRVSQSIGIKDLGATVSSYVSSSPGSSRVGYRKRPQPVAQNADEMLSDGSGTIPVHRSLVLSVDPDDL